MEAGIFCGRLDQLCLIITVHLRFRDSSMDLRKGRVSIVLCLCALSLVICRCEDILRPRLKFLVYTGAEDGSHHMQNINVAKGLIKLGHEVTFLLSSSCTKWLHTSDSHLFDFVVYRSSLTPEERIEISEEFSLRAIRGDLRNVAKITFQEAGTLRERLRPRDLFASECDDLLGDAGAIRTLKERGFDMLIGDDLTWCNPLLAHKLGIRFVLYGSTAIKPAKLQLL